MNDYVIPLNPIILRRQLIVSGVLALLACLITTFFFQYAVSTAPGLQRLLMMILWIGMPTVWIVGALVLKMSYHKTNYILTNEALVIRKAGLFGKGSEQLYGYDTILSVNSTSRKYGAYGTIELILDQQQPVVLSSVASPDEQARRIKKLVAEVKARV